VFKLDAALRGAPALQPPVVQAPAQAETSSGGSKSVAVVATIAIFLSLTIRFSWPSHTLIRDFPLYIALVFGGGPLVVLLSKKLWQREFGSDFLAGISIVTAIVVREFLVATIVVLMLSGGTALEEFATRRASRVLDALAKRMPSVARRKKDDAFTDIALSDIKIGDVLVVFPHQVCPVDGVVVEGRGSMNEAYLTGEPFEIAKVPGAQVLSGALNGESLLTVRTEKLPKDSRYAAIMRVMEETQQRRPRLRRLGDTLGAWFTPVALGIAGIAWVFTGEVSRFLSVLVVATPCPLLIGIPVAVIGAVSLSARRGIIIKNPAILEQIDSCRTFIFDKTGTLTYGKPVLTQVVCASGFAEPQVVAAAASLERFSKHPLAVAVLEHATRLGCALPAVSEVSERPGEGLRGRVDGLEVLVTGRQQYFVDSAKLPPVQPGLECLVFFNGAFAALFRFDDSPRSDSRAFLGHLSPHHNVTKMMLVSGDRDAEVQSLAAKVGITIAYGAKSPEEKVLLVRSESAKQKTVFVGDGINDAPAMQAATVGVAFGHESDITSEAADAVVLERSFGKVDELIHIGHRMRRIALESAIGGMVFSTAGMLFAAFGLLPPIGGAVAQELIDLAVVLNAIRVTFPSRVLRDF
jgi:heavy metal translocating P-type ATPase